MAVATNTYSTAARVQRLIRDLVEGGEFSEATVPTLADIETFLDDTALQLNEAIRSAGYTVPVASTGDDVEANGRLVLANTFGACAMALGMFPHEALDPDNPDSKNRMDYFQSVFDKAIEDIREQKLAATRTTDKLGRVFSGSQEDADGNEKLPVFTRKITDYPGSRALTGT